MFDVGALHVWNCLEQAREGESFYDGDITEVYAQHLVPDKPIDDPWLHASKVLYAMLKQFCTMYSVQASVNGRLVGDWMNDHKLFHKCDVRIFECE